MNDGSGPSTRTAVLTGTGTASDSTCRGRPQIHSRADALRHRDGVRHLVHDPGALDGQARASPARDAERHRAPARAESRLLVYPGPARADHHGVRAAPSVRSHSLAATAGAAREPARWPYSIVHTTIMMAVRALLLIGQPLPPDFPGWRNYTLLTLSDAARLAADDVPLPHRPRLRAGVPPRVGSARAQHVPAGNAAGRSAAAGAAAAAPPALPVQHAQHGVRAHSHRSGRRRQR